MRALSIAATGMAAQDLNVQVIANNIANINTTAFKRGRAEFTDLIYQTERLPGVSSRGQNNTVPEGAQLGLGVRTAAIRQLHIQGSLANTGNQFDLALNGRGWFQVTDANGTILYTRAGAFNTNGNGQIVTTDGLVVNPAMTVPQNALSINVSQTGLVTAMVAGQTAPQQIGQITLANFANDAGLQALGGNLLRADRGFRATRHGPSGRSWVRNNFARLSREFECRSGSRDHQSYFSAAGLSDELEGHSGGFRNVKHTLARFEIT
jgi:flagellar basal-body rod protein FlgG